MIPRYLPALDWTSWRASIGARSSEISSWKEALVNAVAPGAGDRYVYAFADGRSGLFAYFSALRGRRGTGTVILPAQLCTVVARVARKADFAVEAIDCDGNHPTPPPAKYRAGAAAALVVAPVYGYLSPEWEGHVPALGETPVVLDMAQGLLLGERLARPLLRRADAILFSFGLGKGLDTGGGLLLTREPLPAQELTSHGWARYLATFARAAAVRVAAASGAYAHLLSWVDDAARDGFPIRRRRPLAPESLYGLWGRRIEQFRRDVARARERAGRVYALRTVQQACRDEDVYSSAEATHLRQIIRLRDPHGRDALVQALREAGIDCAPAGEPLPHEYLPGADPAGFPEARAFRDSAIRLPFLGRLSEDEFTFFERELNNVLERHLSR